MSSHCAPLVQVQWRGPRMQVQDHGQIQPALAGPDVADITRPFLVRHGCREVAVQQVRCDVECVVAVGGRLEFTCSFNDYPVLTHQPPDTALPHIDADLLQLFGHPGAAIALQPGGLHKLVPGRGEGSDGAARRRAISPRATQSDLPQIGRSRVYAIRNHGDQRSQKPAGGDSLHGEGIASAHGANCSGCNRRIERRTNNCQTCPRGLTKCPVEC